jgi:cytochrome c553
MWSRAVDHPRLFPAIFDRTEAHMRGLLGAALVLMMAALPATAASLEERLAPCLACHGEKGQSEQPEVPSLGAQPAFYVMVQLYMFRERLRTVEVMNAMTQGLTDDDLRSMADIIAKLPPPRPVEAPGDPARLERARALIQQHRCNFCHNPDFSGAQQVPRLAGQREDYLVKALREYKNNTRRGYDAAMGDVLYEISDEQLLDLAYFLTRLP